MAEATEAKETANAEKKKEQSLPFYQLFSFADKYDCVLMIFGSLGAVIHGLQCLFSFCFSVNGFGKNQMDLHKMTHEVGKYALYFVFLGLVVCCSSYAGRDCMLDVHGRKASWCPEKKIFGGSVETRRGIL
ncbi:ABC transporter B family member 19-like [Salvia miltiorrhiza]|uniref:ABC transporter B family member 19-like n=1 Tax=Salvia miltiorrhiza TaxID=226208 RepID=UPI0025ACD61F|nr:ABC transporter B family member 19-like [Salvia miltiorrhiza]